MAGIPLLSSTDRCRPVEIEAKGLEAQLEAAPLCPGNKEYIRAIIRNARRSGNENCPNGSSTDEITNPARIFLASAREYLKAATFSPTPIAECSQKTPIDIVNIKVAETQVFPQELNMPATVSRGERNLHYDQRGNEERKVKEVVEHNGNLYVVFRGETVLYPVQNDPNHENWSKLQEIKISFAEFILRHNSAPDPHDLHLFLKPPFTLDQFILPTS